MEEEEPQRVDPGAAASIPREKGEGAGEGSSCSADEMKPDSNCGEIVGSQVHFPEDILHRIHALMSMRDAAQAACVSHAFLRSWRCYPKLIISVDSLCINEYGSRYDQLTTDFITRVEHIMQNHSGVGVKEFRLQSYPCSTIDPIYLDHWIQVAMSPGIKEFELSLFEIGDIKYSFPCSLLSTERGSSIQSLMLSACSIHSTAQVGCLSSLTDLNLYEVDISGEELLGFLSNSCALEKISLSNCHNIICLKIPCQLQKLNILSVVDCHMLEMIDSNAPNLSTFSCSGRQIHISLEHPFQVKEIIIDRPYSSNAKGKTYRKTVSIKRGKKRNRRPETPEQKNHIITLSSWRFFSSAEHQMTHSSASACKIVQTFVLVLLESHSFQCFQISHAISHATITMNLDANH